MYLRKCRKKAAEAQYTYWQLVESHRTERGPRQRVVAYLSDLQDLRVIARQQAAVIDALTAQVGYKVRKIVIDQAGYGKAVADALLTDPRYGDRYKGGHDMNSNFGGRVEDGTRDERGKAVSKPRKQWATELLKNGLANEAMRRRSEVVA